MKQIVLFLNLVIFMLTLNILAEEIPADEMANVKYIEKIDLMPLLLAKKQIRDDFTVQKVTINGKEMLEVKILKQRKNIWDQFISVKISEKNFEKGDVMSFQYLIKCIESSDESSMGRCTFQHTLPWTGKWIPPVMTKTHSLQMKWERYYLPYTSKDKESDKVCITLELGTYKPQTFLISEAYWYKLPKGTEEKSLPISKITYAGREAGAQWRKEADERIEKYRKGDFTLQVTKKGEPVKNTTVHIKLKHHKFGFALATPPKYFKSGGPFYKKEEILHYFNSIVLPNDFKWPFFKYKHCQAFIPEIMEWSRENDMKNRGHCMVWGAWKHMPPGLEKLKDQPDKLKKIILDHIREMSAGTPPIIYQWDVINEPFTEKDLTNLYGEEILDEILRVSKKTNSNFKAYINDYGIISGTHKLHQDAFFDLLKRLKERDVPYDGIGFQAYYGSFPISPVEIKKRLDRFNVLGKEMYITEFNMDLDDPDLFADYTRDLLTISFSYPAMTGFACWVDMWNSDGTPSKALKNWDTLVNKTWQTELTLETDENGEIKFRGFRGNYNIDFDYNGEKEIYTVDFSDTDKQSTF